jgi:hypothetical protein
VRAATSSAALAGVVGGFLIVALLLSATLQARTRLSNWNPEYPLLIGNEHTGDRPWRGRVFAHDISDAATPAASVRRFSAGESVVIPGTPIATFNFDGGPPYKDASGNLPDLEWTERPNAPRHSGVWLTGGAWLEGARPASALAQRLRQTNAFTLRIRCATDDTNQEGPARIVSHSVSPFLRNFTLGQQGSDLVVRLRTPDTGVNGYPLEIYVPGMFADRDTHEILATYDGATLLVAMARRDDISSTALTPGSSVALAIPRLNVRPDQLPLYELAYVAALSLEPGALIGFSHTRAVMGCAQRRLGARLRRSARGDDRASKRRLIPLDPGHRAVGVGAVMLTVFNAIFSSGDSIRRRPSRLGAEIAQREPLGYAVEVSTGQP